MSAEHGWPDYEPTPWLWGAPYGPAARATHAVYLDALRDTGLIVPAALATGCKAHLRHWARMLDVDDGIRLYGLECRDHECQAPRLVVATRGYAVVDVYEPGDWLTLPWISREPQAVLDHRYKQAYWARVKEQQTCSPSQ